MLEFAQTEGPFLENLEAFMASVATVPTAAPDLRTTPAPRGLTTTESPYINEQLANKVVFIRQPYEEYNAENQEAWRELCRRIRSLWDFHANPRFLEGVEILHLDTAAIPRLEDINRFLKPRTGFQAKAVSGYIAPGLFFDCLRKSEFPTTITIRRREKLDYLPEPDIFHDVAGHVPMHTDKTFAKVLVFFGELAREATLRAADMKDRKEGMRVLDCNIKALARFFWFTIEFGLMRERPGSEALKVYGSGLLSSYGEIARSIKSDKVQRQPLQLDWVINQYFEIDHFQPLLFVVDSFDHLFDQIELLAKQLRAGKLDNVSPGKPSNTKASLRSFMTAAHA